MGSSGPDVLAGAAAAAPSSAGIYVFLGEGGEVLYVGKAVDLKRRLRQHAAMGPATSHLHARYDHVRQIRWEVAVDDTAAAWREGDLIFALHPPFNAETGPRSRGGPNRLLAASLVTVDDGPGGRRRMAVTTTLPTSGRAYGCFPHLGRGVATRIGVACSDGYTAMLRLLWAASGEGDQYPAAVTRSAPDRFDVSVHPEHVRPLHDFLVGRSSRLVGMLAEAANSRPAYMQPALQRDRVGAAMFFVTGPRLLDQRCRRHGLRPPVAAADYRTAIVAELRESIGAFGVTQG